MALARLAQNYLETPSGRSSTYLAGLWSGNFLLFGLLWNTYEGEGAVQVSYRPQEYRAPSWSWASVEGRIEWSLRLRTIESSEDEMVVTIDASTVLKTNHATGQVTGGKLTIQGPLLLAHLSHDSSTRDNPQIEGSDCLDQMELDEPAKQPPETCFCLAILCRRQRQRPRSRWVLLGLGLVEMDDGLYKRIGLFHSYENHELFEAQD
jgi:hypothetical protein